MNAYLDEIDSPMGPVAFAANEEGALLGLRFRDGWRPRSLEKQLEDEGFALSRDEDRAAATREQLVEYFAGERRSFDPPVARRETIFEEAVWEEISRIPYGETRTYGEVARSIGWPGEAVEVGKACAANPVLLVVPYHELVKLAGAGALVILAQMLLWQATSWLLVKLFGYDLPTAALASSPGGISGMIPIASQTEKTDTAAVTLAHLLRLSTIVAVVPVFAALFFGR